MNQRLLFPLLLWFSFSFVAKNVFPDDFDLKNDYTNIKEAIFLQGKLTGGDGPKNITWIDNGNRFSYTEEKNNSQEIHIFNPENGQDELLFETKNLNFPEQNKAFNYNSFQWSKNFKYILFQTNFRKVWRRSGESDFYFYSITDKSLKLVAKDARTAEISPDGLKVGFERDGNLFVFDFVTQDEIQLTDDADEYFYNGRFGWVYEEEFGLAQAWAWSPDSKFIAFWKSDERKVPIFQMTDYSGQHAQYVNVPYPKVGDPGPEVQIGVINLDQKTIKWMDTSDEGGYIPRIYWTSEPGKIAIVQLNRKQNHLKLFFNDAISGKGELIMEEISEQWIDVFDFTVILHFFVFPEDKKEFYWVSDRDGWSHIYRYDYQGNLINQVTKGNWEVLKINGINPKNNTIYYTSTENSPLERHLYAINVNGKNKKALTEQTGVHSVNLSSNGKYYIDSYSNINLPRQVELWSTKNKMLKKFEDNNQVTQFISRHFYAPKELFSFITTDGQKLDGYIIKPKNFDPNKKYPLVMNIYGGPGSEFVLNTFATDIWEQYAAQEGYVIANVNNRGSGGYGSKFEKIVYKNLGKWQSYDFVETAKHLSSFSWIDGDRMAIKGISFGGFMSSYTMLHYPGIFKVSLVGAPVVDWRLYDNVYTERYMSLLSDNQPGYESCTSISAAANLKGKMFIAHSCFDENVHLQNTMQLVRAFIDNGKDVDLRIYPPGGHHVGYSEISNALLYAQYIDYLNKYLKGDNSSCEVEKINN